MVRTLELYTIVLPIDKSRFCVGYVSGLLINDVIQCLGLGFLPADVDSVEFSIEVGHKGFFVGYGYVRTYVDGKADWFDHIEANAWSTLLFEDFV